MLGGRIKYQLSVKNVNGKDHLTCQYNSENCNTGMSGTKAGMINIYVNKLLSVNYNKAGKS